jgi:hypothetical protein
VERAPAQAEPAAAARSNVSRIIVQIYNRRCPQGRAGSARRLFDTSIAD